MFRRGRLRAEDLAIGIGPVPINGLSPRSAQPLVISVTMAPPVSNAEIYCAVQRRKAGDSERRPSLAHRLAADDRTSDSNGERP